MSIQPLLDQLLALSDLEEQKAFLRAHESLQRDEVAAMLKERSRQLLFDNAQECLAMAELLLCLANYTGDSNHQALGLEAKAHALSIAGLGEYQQAVDLYDEAAHLHRVAKRPVQEAQTQVSKVWSLACLGCYDEAVNVERAASIMLAEHEEWLLLARLKVNMGVIYYRIAEYDQALAMYDQAYGYYNQLDMNQELQKAHARLANNRANVLRNLGQFDESIRVSKEVFELLSEIGGRIEAARTQQSLAVTYFVLGRFNEALALLNEIHEVFLADGRWRDAALLELFISDCLLQLRRFDDVLEKCQQIRTLFNQIGTPHEVARALLNEAIAYSSLDQFENAQTSLIEARTLFVNENNVVGIAGIDMEQASVFIRRGRLNDGLQLALSCAYTFQENSLPIEQAQALLVAAQAAFELYENESARQLLADLLADTELMDMPTLAYQTYYLLGALERRANQSTQALVNYQKAIEELERLRGRLMVEFRARFVEDKQMLYEDAIDLCLTLERPLDGLAFAERAKSRALLDLIGQRLDLRLTVRSEQDAPLVAELQKLRAKRDQLYRNWEFNEASGLHGTILPDDEQRQAQRDVLQLEKEITECWNRLLVRHADYAQEASLWYMDSAPIQPYLDADTLLLEYFVMRAELVIFIVGSSTVDTARVPFDAGKIQDLMLMLHLNFHAVARSKNTHLPQLVDNAQSILQQLFSELVAPIGNTLQSFDKLIIVPHGYLHYIPFHALYDGEHYLLERYEISYLPNAQLLRYPRNDQAGPTNLLTLSHSYNGQLPYVHKEAAAIANLFPSVTYSDQAASVRQLQEKASGYSILHLAAHADFRADNPLFSGIALEDGWLTTLDVFTLRLNASLVTLSACQTGQHVIGGGDELLGLMRAFLYAGTSSMVLSFWAVEDRSTSKLMAEFYGNLANGQTKSAALGNAQRKMIHPQLQNTDHTSGRYCHPYFWAAFFLVGDPGIL